MEDLNNITLKKIPLKSWQFHADFEPGCQQNQESDIRTGYVDFLIRSPLKHLTT